MPVRLRLLLLPVLVATAALVAAGCSVSIGDKTIDAGSVEDQISQNLESQGEEVDAVECPGDQKAEQGTTFECDVTFADGTTRTAQIELVDDEGTFNFTIPPADGADTGAGADTGGGDGATDEGATDEGTDTGE